MVSGKASQWSVAKALEPKAKKAGHETRFFLFDLAGPVAACVPRIHANFSIMAAARASSATVLALVSGWVTASISEQAIIR